MRDSSSGSDSVQNALDKQGRYKTKEKTDYYVYSLHNFPNHLKPGIEASKNYQEGKTSNRASNSLGHYKERLLHYEFETREQAFFLEQAVLEETLSRWDCPDELRPHPNNDTWRGWTEVRKIELSDLEPIIEFYREELREMKVWKFAATYLGGIMTQAQTEECERRAAEEANG